MARWQPRMRRTGEAEARVSVRHVVWMMVLVAGVGLAAAASAAPEPPAVPPAPGVEEGTAAAPAVPPAPAVEEGTAAAPAVPPAPGGDPEARPARTFVPRYALTLDPVGAGLGAVFGVIRAGPQFSVAFTPVWGLSVRAMALVFGENTVTPGYAYGAGIEVGPRIHLEEQLRGFYVLPLVDVSYAKGDAGAGVAVAPGIGLGYAWCWNNGLYLDVAITGRYLFLTGDLKGGDKFSLVQPMMHLSLGYAF